MITVVKGNSKIVVTKATYEEQLKKLGYQIASESKGATKQVAPLLDIKEEKIELKQDSQEEEKESLSEKFGLSEKKTTKKGK